MKRFILACRPISILTLAFAVLCLQCVSASASVTNGLVLHYDFNTDEGTTVTDLSGTGNDGTPVDDASWIAEGIGGGAYEFDGSGDYINIPDHTSLRMATNSFSISAWFKTSAQISLNQGIFYKCNPSTSFGEKLYRLTLMKDVGHLNFVFDDNVASAEELETAGYDYRDDVWHHVVFVRDRASDKLRMYEGGVEITNVTDTIEGTIENAFDCSIGGNFHYVPNGDSQYFDGLIDEVKVYDGALTPNEVAQLYQEGVTNIVYNQDAGLVAYYPFNSNADDESGNGNHGTVNGSTWTSNGVAGGAYSFDGDDYISVPNSAELNFGTNDFSVSMFVKFDDMYWEHVLIEMFSQSPLDGWTFVKKIDHDLHLAIADSGEYGLSASATLTSNQWYQLAFVKSGSSYTIYQDGVELGTGSSPKDVDSVNNMILGSRSGSINFLKGTLDEVRVYSRALISNEVAQLYQEGVTNIVVATPPASLVLHYDFNTDEGTTVTDLSGTGNDGMPVDDASWIAEGIGGGAYEFDGSGDYINIPDHTSLRMATNSFSISAWFKTSRSDGKHQGIFYKINPETPAGEKLYRLILRGNGGDLEGHLDDNVASAVLARSSGYDYQDGQWHHVVFVRDMAAGRLRVYEGGAELTNTTDTISASIENTFDCSIGGNFHYVPNGDSQYFDGLIDEVKVYDGALASSEVLQLYQEGVTNIVVASQPTPTTTTTIPPTTTTTTIPPTTTTTTIPPTTTTTIPPIPEDGKCYNDYDGDGVSDLSVFDTDTGKWYIYSLSKGVLAWDLQWGWADAKPVPGDYDGDGVWDLAVFDENSGDWYIKSLSEGVLSWGTKWGWPGAIAVPGDYDGDGKTDIALFDNTTGGWYILSTTGDIVSWGIPWGWPGAVPVAGDYNGDGADDLAVYDTNTGYWYILSLTGEVVAWGTQWGWPGAQTIPGDYDGDGSEDLAVFDHEGGSWYVLSLTGDVILWGTPWGWSDADPIPGDYDGDGKDDLAVFDNATGYWYILSMSGDIITWGFQWGWSGCDPVSIDDDDDDGNNGHGNDDDRDDDSNPGNGNADADVAGSWVYMVTSSGSGGGTMVLSQSGSVVYGNLYSTGGETAVVNGSMTSDSLSITVVYSNGDVIYLSSAVSGDSMTGSWVTDTGDTGTWSASR